MQTDSFGNELPKGIILNDGATPEMRTKVDSINSFRLTALVSMDCGETVLYNAEAKQATIKDQNGIVSFISHE